MRDLCILICLVGCGAPPEVKPEPPLARLGEFTSLQFMGGVRSGTLQIWGGPVSKLCPLAPTTMRATWNGAPMTLTSPGFSASHGHDICFGPEWKLDQAPPPTTDPYGNDVVEITDGPTVWRTTIYRFATVPYWVVPGNGVARVNDTLQVTTGLSPAANVRIGLQGTTPDVRVTGYETFTLAAAPPGDHVLQVYVTHGKVASCDGPQTCHLWLAVEAGTLPLTVLP